MSKPEIIRHEVEKIMAGLLRQNMASLREAWKSSLDEDSLGHAFPVAFEKGRLIVVVDNPVYLQNMMLKRREILDLMREKPGCGAVSEITFRMGSVS